ncbi:hypothetical protein BCR34DRAFT_620565 [Clohesyomyces aquaticus]|uniref:Uncharacterized protein n=1 Tax=Clohesyomyces aquaticus TaxID=1231657 RepID=A0A1Y1Y2C8_9PLEO|nr:hypothetical protein BCR34DRAFT_620565 [Clohesyomyces aquaticus]
MSLIMSTFTPTPTPNASSSPTPFPVSSASQPPTTITGLSVFWPLFTLALASCLHGLGSSPISPSRYSAKYRYYIRGLPLSGFLDSMCFLYQSIQHGALAVVISRLRQNEAPSIYRLSPLPGRHHPNPSPSLSPGEEEELLDEPLDRCSFETLETMLDLAFDLRIRVFPNASILLAYAKLCTYSGVPWSLTLGTMYLVSWLVLEGGLVVQHFSRRRAKLEEAVMVARALNRPTWRTGKAVVLVGRLVVVGQVIALLTILITGIIHRRDGILVPTHAPSKHFVFPSNPWWMLRPIEMIDIWAREQERKVSKPYKTMDGYRAVLYLVFVIYAHFILMMVIMVIYTDCTWD